MNEIEKMYENAGINATAKTKEVRHNLFECGLFYPDFTAEKQLKIIQLLSKIRDAIQLCYSDNQYIFVVNFETEKCQWANKYHVKLDEALADMVNVLWQSLTEEEKEQIREILK